MHHGDFKMAHREHLFVTLLRHQNDVKMILFYKAELIRYYTLVKVN